MPKLILILGDQLNMAISSLQQIDRDVDTILLAEVWDEATYVKHHKKKIALIFTAMRHFAAELSQEGFSVRYVKLDDSDNTQTIKNEVGRACVDLASTEVVATEAAEFRLLDDMRHWQQDLGIPVSILQDSRFLATQTEFSEWAEGKKQLRMEFFYREMRRKYRILMEGDQPIGGKWNYDKQNRQSLPAKQVVPAPSGSEPDRLTLSVLDLVEQRFSSHFGDLMPFRFAVNREQALQVLNNFITQRLPLFGDYQDAMAQDEPWLFHSHISFYLNCGLLLPLETIKAAEAAYYAGQAPLNAVEGFIRQILGWREYVRGLYWLKMPEYKHHNHLLAHRSLPEFFWTGKTKMNCLSQCISETKENAYAHHIQRLMVLGNFALLAGLSPDEVNEWYLIVYADAYEWVELPNVSGMILFADGGVLASKPYAASGAYIHKMSDYCQHCHYNVKEKNGSQACPFNYLYWDFLHRNIEKLGNNPRLGMPYRTLANMTDEKHNAVKRDAEIFFRAIETNEEV